MAVLKRHVVIAKPADPGVSRGDLYLDSTVRVQQFPRLTSFRIVEDLNTEVREHIGVIFKISDCIAMLDLACSYDYYYPGSLAADICAQVRLVHSRLGEYDSPRVHR
jgi:hypothetical protein